MKCTVPRYALSVAPEEFFAVTVTENALPAVALAGAVTVKEARALTVTGLLAALVAVHEWNTAVTVYV